MRRKAVAGMALIAALALAAMPGPATSRQPSPVSATVSGSYRALSVPAILSGVSLPAGESTAAWSSAATVDAASSFAEPGEDQPAPVARPEVDQPASPAGSGWKPPKSTLTGLATFYDNGTTAMRLPRGTVIVVCMAGGCLERVVNDYGPFGEGRIVDLDRDDFFAICGCPWWSGVEPVTVRVYGT